MAIQTDDTYLPGVAARLERLPYFREVVASIEAAIEGAPANFWRAEDVLRAVTGQKLLNEVLNRELARMQEYPFHAPPVSSYNRFTLYASPTCELSALRTGGQSGTESLHTLAADAIVLVLAGPLNVGLYETDVEDFSIFDPSKKLKSCCTASFSAGETFRIVAGQQVVRFLKGGSPAWSLCLSSAVQLDLTWEYDPVTLLPARLLADNLQTSRIEYAVKILGEVGTADSVPVLEELFLHPAHYVRWAVVKSIMAIDEDAGMQILQAAARDRHPEVRAAASRSLSRVRGILHSS